MEKAKRGDTIEWTIGPDQPVFAGTHQAEVASIDEEKEHYCVYASYGPDLIPFDQAKIIKKKL